MNYQEVCLPLKDVGVGMTLARSVSDLRGHVLMASGTELDGATINALRRRDVSEVWVLPVIPPEAWILEKEAANIARNKERLARLFRHTGNSADDLYLYKLMASYRGVTLP